MTTIATFHVPDDDKVLAAVGEVAIRHEHMNYVLRMTIKSLAGVSVRDAVLATKYDGSAQLRETVRKLARKRLGDGAALIRVRAYLTEFERLTKKRNDLVHGLWAEELDGEAHVRDAHGAQTPVPTSQELRALAQEIAAGAGSLNYERLQGFLKEALEKDAGLSPGRG